MDTKKKHNVNNITSWIVTFIALAWAIVTIFDYINLKNPTIQGTAIFVAEMLIIVVFMLITWLDSIQDIKNSLDDSYDLDIIENKFQDIAATPDAIIKIKYIDKNNHIPLTRIEGEKSNWIDLRANQDYILKKGDFEYIDLGVAMELPYGYEGILAPRSSTFKKFGIIAANSIGIIDNKFNGDDDIWKFPALALRDTEIHKNDRICQFRIQRVQPVIEFKTVDNLNNISRGGFGSTGSN